jgi:TPR repeat protein
MFLLGEYFENLYKLYPPENPYNGNYLDNAIEYYQKALDNGYNKAAKILKELYISKGDIDNASKYLKYDIYTRDS